MNPLPQINALDVAILAALAAGLFAGWSLGVIRQLLGLAAFYVALVFGAQLHPWVSGWIRSIGSQADWVLVDAMSFVAIFLVVLLAFNWAGFRVYKDTRVPILKALDNVLGGILGVFSAILFLVIGLAVLRFAFSVPWQEWDGLRLEVTRLYTDSTLEKLFYGFTPTLYLLIRPWLPGGLPAIFSF